MLLSRQFDEYTAHSGGTGPVERFLAHGFAAGKLNLNRGALIMDGGFSVLALLLLGVVVVLGGGLVVAIVLAFRRSTGLPHCPQCNRTTKPGVECCPHWGKRFK